MCVGKPCPPRCHPVPTHTDCFVKDAPAPKHSSFRAEGNPYSAKGYSKHQT